MVYINRDSGDLKFSWQVDEDFSYFAEQMGYVAVSDNDFDDLQEGRKEWHNGSIQYTKAYAKQRLKEIDAEIDSLTTELGSLSSEFPSKTEMKRKQEIRDRIHELESERYEFA